MTQPTNSKVLADDLWEHIKEKIATSQASNFKKPDSSEAREFEWEVLEHLSDLLQPRQDEINGAK